MEAAAEEEALRLLHAHEYDGALALEAVEAAAPPPSRAPWTAAQVLSFDSGLLSHGKNFSLIAQSVGRPMADIVRRYYERKCRTEVRRGELPCFLSATPISARRALREEREAAALLAVQQRPAIFPPPQRHAMHHLGRMAPSPWNPIVGPGGFVLHRPAVWQTAGEIVPHPTGPLVNGIYCAPASAVLLGQVNVAS